MNEDLVSSLEPTRFSTALEGALEGHRTLEDLATKSRQRTFHSTQRGKAGPPCRGGPRDEVATMDVPINTTLEGASAGHRT